MESRILIDTGATYNPNNPMHDLSEQQLVVSREKWLALLIRLHTVLALRPCLCATLHAYMPCCRCPTHAGLCALTPAVQQQHSVHQLGL